MSVWHMDINDFILWVEIEAFCVSLVVCVCVCVCITACSFNNSLLNVHYMPETVPGSDDTRNKIDKGLCSL